MSDWDPGLVFIMAPTGAGVVIGLALVALEAYRLSLVACA